MATYSLFSFCRVCQCDHATKRIHRCYNNHNCSTNPQQQQCLATVYSPVVVQWLTHKAERLQMGSPHGSKYIGVHLLMRCRRFETFSPSSFFENCETSSVYVVGNTETLTRSRFQVFHHNVVQLNLHLHKLFVHVRSQRTRAVSSLSWMVVAKYISECCTRE